MREGIQVHGTRSERNVRMFFIENLIAFRLREEANNGVMPNMYFRLVTKDKIDKMPEARAAMANDHQGRYNTPDSTMVLFVYRVKNTFIR